jgi:hypothetical protein
MSSTADDHSSIADSLTSQVVEVLRVVERRSDAVKQKVGRNLLYSGILSGLLIVLSRN